MNINDAFEITRGLNAELSQGADRNRFISWNEKYMSVQMDQEDGFIYISDGDAKISIPPAYADRLATIMEIADRIYRNEEP